MHHYYVRITIQWPRMLAENQRILSWKRNLRIPSQGVWRGQAKHTVWFWLQMHCSFIPCLVLSQVISYFLTLSSIRWNGHHLGFPGGTVVKNLPANARDTGLIPGSGRYPGVGNPLQYFCRENSMDRGAWWAIIHGFAKNRTQLSTYKRLGGMRILFICPSVSAAIATIVLCNNHETSVAYKN